jgi:hypothetical protein
MSSHTLGSQARAYSDIRSDSFPTSFTETLSAEGSSTNSSLFSQIGQNRAFFQWTRKHHEEFLEWWLNTSWVVRNIRDSDADLAKRLNWDSQNRTSAVWADYDQAANRHNGTPVVICRQCGASLAHPNVKATGTKALASHISTAQCRKGSVGRGGRQQSTISQSFQSALVVSLISIKISIKG